MKKTKVLLISVIVSIIAMITLLLLIMNKTNLLSSTGLIKLDPENEQELFSYVVYDNQDENNIKVLATVYSDNGIEYININNNENKITGNGKNKIAFDYNAKKNQTYTVKIKEVGKSEVSKSLVVNDALFESVDVKFETTYQIDGYKSVEISKLLYLSDYKLSYQLGTTGEWKDIEGKSEAISILDYDIKSDGLMNEDNTVTLSIKLQNTKNNNIINYSKKYAINPNSTLQAIPQKSLIDAVENIKATGLYKVYVNGETYNLRAYYYNKDLTLAANTSIGSADDVATSNSYAKNMVVLKVDGNITINSGIKLTTVASSGGYGGPKGFLIYCSGTLTNNGTISMTARGAWAEGQNVYLWQNADESYEYVPATGGAGAAGVVGPIMGSGIPYYHAGYKGTNGTKRQTGGGGSGSTTRRASEKDNYTSGNGSSGTSYSGGSGGAPSGTGLKVQADSGKANGGAGGMGFVYKSSSSFWLHGSGAGNPSPVSTSGNKSYSITKGEDGTGGLLIISANNFINNNLIDSNGSKGSSGGLGTSIYNEMDKIDALQEQPAGSSGGGSINIFYRNLYQNSGNVIAHGGAAPVNQKESSAKGGAGGEGSVSVGQIVDGSYVSTYKNY